MPAGTVNLSALTAQVPVDRFEIVDGPGAIRCMKAQARIHDSGGYADLSFTLTTAASTARFRRTLKVATIFAVEGTTFNFTAVFCGRVVSGVYNMQARTGWFNLD